MTEIRNHAAVLGKPIAHSLSPVIHNTAYQARGLSDWHYDRYEVDEHMLGDFIDSLNSSWHGLSLTMPLKKAIMPMGETCNHWAEKLGVANTAVFDWKPGVSKPHIRLYNTDVAGINLAITNALRKIQPPAPAHSMKRPTKNALIIGSGNTATSAIAACSTMQVGHITLAARHAEKAHALAPLAQTFGMTVDVIALPQISEIVSSQDIAICTLPSHAGDPIAQSLMALEDHTIKGILLDVCYDPRPTDLMNVWRTHGGTAIGGEEMLLYQAIPQIAYMTGIDFDALPKNLDTTIRTALEEIL